MRVDEELLNKAIERLDRVVGWLTYFGSLSIHYGASEKLLKRFWRRKVK